MHLVHLTDETVEQLFTSDLSRSKRKEAVRHLLLGCEECRQRARTAALRLGVFLSPNGDGEVREDAYDGVFERVGKAAAATLLRLREEKAAAPVLGASLEERSPSERFDVIAGDPRMHTWGLYDRLLETAREITPAEPKRALELAELALTVADHLDPAVYTAPRIADFHAAALAVRGNCKRVLEDFEGAGVDLDEASGLLRHGSGDPLERAAVLSYQGSFLTDLGSYAKARRVLDRAIRIYAKAGDEPRVGRTMLQQAGATGYVDPAEAVEILVEAARFIDPVRDPYAEISRRHNLALFLNDAGRTAEAVKILEESRSLYGQFPDLALRRAWLEGKIARNLGDLPEAGRIFERVAAGFLARSQFQEHLLASLDLAEVCYARGDRERTLEICTDLQHALESWTMQAEATAAMVLFVQAVREDHAERDAFLRLAETLRRSWHRLQRAS